MSKATVTFSARGWVASALLASALLAVVLIPASAPARSTANNLKLMVEVRERIHRFYVDQIDSISLVTGAIDGLVAALPEGENLFVSSADWAAVQDNGAEQVPGSILSNAGMTNKEQLQLLEEAYRAVSRKYVRPVASDSLSHGAIWGMLATLDPHSSFVRPRDVERMLEKFRGDFEGIGIYFEVRRGRLLVISPILGSPADGKLRAGDYVTLIDGIATDGITTEQVMKKLRGPKGSTVEISVERQGESEWLDYSIQRDRIAVSSVPYVYMIRPGTGYIRITRFSETTGADLAESMEQLRSQGMRRLLLDLRQNGGGLLSQAVEVADHFVDAGDLIVYTQGRDPGQRREFRGQTKVTGLPMPLVVLLDHGSASASEIVAGAVQDLDLGLIAGETSFGKGLVQEQFRLSKGAGLLLLTVARYYTPLGRLIQRPYTDDVRAYLQEGFDDVDPNAVDSLRAVKAKFNTASGRVVYGGGGITPDYVLSPSDYSDWLAAVMGSDVLFDFASSWVAGRSDWPGDFEDYFCDFAVSDGAVAALSVSLAEQDIALDQSAPGGDGDILRRHLKAEFARVLWGDEAHYRVRLEGDTQVEGALQLFDEAEQLLVQRQDHYSGNN